MSLKARAVGAMPDDIGAVGKQLLREDSPYRLIGEKLIEHYHDRDFADLYAKEGKPAISPVILAFVTVFQFMERLPDRQAAEALRVRLDWKYALHLPLGYAGFDFSVLSEFRDRLIAHEAEGRVFEQLVEQLREMGLIKERGRQRTDSIAMLTKVRKLSRLELVVETLRLAVGGVLEVAREWGERLIPPSWEERYGQRFVMQRLTEGELAKVERAVGADGVWFLERLREEGAPRVAQKLPIMQVLETVWAQQFREVEGQVVYQEVGPYDGRTRIQTPHDPEARYSKKRRQEWVGDKVQVTETDDEELPHLITDMEVTASVQTDYEALPQVQNRLQERQLLPGRHYVDSGYMSGPNLAHSHDQEIDLIGPLQTVVTPQTRLADGLTVDQFAIDVQQGTATCPAGQRVHASSKDDQMMRFRYPEAVCRGCALRARCCTGRKGRTLGVGIHYDLLRAARRRQETEAFKEDYRQHRSGVEGTLSALVRGQGLRIGRYIGTRKRHLQAVFTGTASNIRRTAAWLAGNRPQIRKSGLGLNAAT